MISELGRISDFNTGLYGGKALVLDRLSKNGFKIPEGIVLSTEIYSGFIRETGLEEFLFLNVEQKELETMRWEEVWDLAQRIRLRFLRTALPPALESEILKEVGEYKNIRAVVRSSSPAEDSSSASYAGLHESIVDVTGEEPILNAVKEVWSSLWSDRALIYGREMHLNPAESAMAVIIQKLVVGVCSGVMFTQSPSGPGRILIESVEGLNEKLVSGAAEPDRYTLSRETGDVVERVYASERGDRFFDPPLLELFRTGLEIETLFGFPQDIEWTQEGNHLCILQARPVTTTEQADKPLWQMEDKREWYKSLRKNLTQLNELKYRIEKEFMIELDELSLRLSEPDLSVLDDAALQEEIEKRKSLLSDWEKEYWEICIPFAHGVRMFGEIYNKILKPENPFEFCELLISRNLKSVERNERLAGLAETLKEKGADSAFFREELHGFMEVYGQSSFFDSLLFEDRASFIEFLRSFSGKEAVPKESTAAIQLETRYLNTMAAAGREDGAILLELGRISYKLRDDDNIQLGKLRGELYRAESELRLRHNEVKAADEKPEVDEVIEGFRFSQRQVTGACASPGFAQGRARVIKDRDDLFQTRKGEIIVCDSIDPNITFIIPLAAAIVERRGGMLVHGAIIAREYRIPCITGVPNAAEIINNGDHITVDAFNGIVVIDKVPGGPNG